MKPDTAMVDAQAPQSGLDPLDQAIVQTLVYADVFDYPLRSEEIHRYLVGHACTPEDVRVALAGSAVLAHRLAHQAPFYTLKGREHLVAERKRRTAASAALWPKALVYARWLAALPFVRMLAVSGSLSMDNSRDGCDVDFLIITKPGCLWRCRILTKIFQVLDRRFGAGLVCPNFFLSERALSLDRRNFYTAHELVQMVPVYGSGMYQAMRRANAWCQEVMPNAAKTHRAHNVAPRLGPGLKRLGEFLLGGWPGARLEAWESKRKIRRYAEKGYGAGGSAYSAFTLEATGHRLDIADTAMERYRDRLAAVSAKP